MNMWRGTGQSVFQERRGDVRRPAVIFLLQYGC